MENEKIIQKTGPKYSEMLIEIVEKFDKQFPKEFSFEGVLKVVIDVWNVANRKEFLISNNLYEEELKEYKKYSFFKEMVDYKIEKFSEYNNVIIDYTVDDNRVQVKSQTQENNFNQIFKKIIMTKPKIK